MAEAAMMGGGGAPSDTFLTDMLIPGSKKRPPSGKKKGKATFQSAQKPSTKPSAGASRLEGIED